MLYVVILFLWASICLYLLLGGADFGAGILELFSNKKREKEVSSTMYRAIGPIWEANHMWLIIAIVILFVGFPKIYTTLSVYLHLPLVLMLLGIIARGTAFSFRHYDAIDDQWQKLYSKIYVISSLLTPFFLGMIAAATVSRTIDTEAPDFLAAYVWSWFNPFGLSVGVFTVCICSYLAAIFIVGKSKNDSEQRYFIRKSKRAMIAVVTSGLIVFITAHLSAIPLLNWVLQTPIGRISLSLASISLIFTFFAFKHKKVIALRILAGFQIIMILVAATHNHYPEIILFKNGTSLSLIDDMGSQKTIDTLAWALLIGSIFILPSLFYLIYSFGGSSKKNAE